MEGPALLGTVRRGGSALRPAGGVALAAVLVLVGVAISASSADRYGPGTGPDAYGYTALDDSDPRCAYQFVDISGGGTPVSFTPSGAEPAADDGGALVTLADAFELYGQAVTTLVMSSNGYLAAAGSLLAEDGGDFSNDCPLPAVPGNDDGVAARIMAYHDDLSGASSGGGTQVAYFSVCPRPSGAIADEPCTIFQWTDWGFHDSADVVDLQAVLYHTSFEVVVQVAAGDSSQGGSATVGLQDAGARTALLYDCNQPGAIPGGTAVCFYDPRFPVGGPVADLAVEVTDKQESAAAGDPLVYTIGVTNMGPSPVSGATVADQLPDALSCTWSCEAGAGAACSTTGAAGDLLDTGVVLPPTGEVAYTATCTIADDASGTLVNTVVVSGPRDVIDPDATNNAASDSTTLLAGAELEATKTAGGSFFPGGRVVYTLTIHNLGAGDQLDNPGDEVVDALPPEVELESATVLAGGGDLAVDTTSDLVRWNGAVPALGEVAIQIVGTIGPVAVGTSISNQAVLAWDSTGDGTNDAAGLSDDPSAPGAQDPTTFTVGEEIAGIPTASDLGLLLLAVLIAGAALLLLRRNLGR